MLGMTARPDQVGVLDYQTCPVGMIQSSRFQLCLPLWVANNTAVLLLIYNIYMQTSASHKDIKEQPPVDKPLVQEEV
jgi:hypothetical protein